MSYTNVICGYIDEILRYKMKSWNWISKYVAMQMKSAAMYPFYIAMQL
jgi:hypothetical protein